MMAESLQLRTLVKPGGELELSLAQVPMPEPTPDEVLVRIEAAPINPSDIGLLFGAADMSTARSSGPPDRPIVTAVIPERAMTAMAGRQGQSLPAGNEGAGVVIAAGSSTEAQALIGRTVAIMGGAMFAQHRCIKAADCLVLPDDVTPAQGAACFVNPLTALGMVGTMHLEGHSALVHTAAASNLGQMLNRVCLEEKIGLVNIVRSAEQAALLRGMGAAHVCDSTTAGFMDDLTEAVSATGATLAFDAIGGGALASQILTAMERAANRTAQAYSRYGSSVHKQVYVYGSLNTGPTVLERAYGMAWGLGGWLLTPFLMKIGPDGIQALKGRVVAGLRTTFASRYTRTVSLTEALRLDVIAAYSRRATGEKVLINPRLDAGA